MTADALEDFWNLAREHAGLVDIPVYFGTTPLGAVPPPAWSFGDTPAEADRFVEGLLDGSVSEVTSSVSDYEGEDDALPQAGTLAILTDGSGQPQVLVVTSGVEVSEDGRVVEQLKVLYRR